MDRVVRTEKDGEASNEEAGSGSDKDHLEYAFLSIAPVLKLFRFSISSSIVILRFLADLVLRCDPFKVLDMKRCLGLQSLITELKVRTLLALPLTVSDDNPLKRCRSRIRYRGRVGDNVSRSSGLVRHFDVGCVAVGDDNSSPEETIPRRILSKMPSTISCSFSPKPL